MKREIKKVLFGTHGTGGVLFLIVFGILVYAIIWDSFQPDYPIHIVDRDRVDVVERERLYPYTLFNGKVIKLYWNDVKMTVVGDCASRDSVFRYVDSIGHIDKRMSKAEWDIIIMDATNLNCPEH